MSTAMWLLVIAWGVLATVSSIPWFVHAGWRVVDWMHNPGLQTIIELHTAGLFGPLVAGLGLWRGRCLTACVGLTIVSVAWLSWHIFTFTQVAWIVRDGPRLLLSIVTLGVVVVYALGQARSEVR
jgi:hypothetical protein